MTSPGEDFSGFSQGEDEEGRAERERESLTGGRDEERDYAMVQDWRKALDQVRLFN